MSFPRYPAYKDSEVEWLGAVPAHWDVAPFKRMVSLQNGSDHKHIECDDGYPVIGSGGPFAQASEFMHDGESVLLGRKGTIDKPLYVTGKFWTVDTMYWSKIQPSAFGRFAYYSALTIPFGYYSTNTALPSMTKSVLEAHLLATPPEQEQVAVAAFLDRETTKIDALVAEQEQLITLLKEKRQAVISHAVTKGLDPSVPMKDSGVEWLGEVPVHWAVRQVRSISCFITSGPRGWSERVGEEGALFIQSGDLTANLSIAFEQAKRVTVQEDAEASRTRLMGGDVVVCITGAKTGNVAVCAEVPEAAYVNQHLCLIRPTEDVLPQFLGVFLKSDAGQRYFAIAQYGLKQGLSLENIKALPVAVPPDGEQAAIVALVEHSTGQLDHLIDEAVLSIELLRERRSALVSAAVTGQIDVRAV